MVLVVRVRAVEVAALLRICAARGLVLETGARTGEHKPYPFSWGIRRFLPLEKEQSGAGGGVVKIGQT